MLSWRPRGTRLSSTLAVASVGLTLTGCELLVGNDPANTGMGGAGLSDDGGSNNQNVPADASVDDSSRGADGTSSTTGDAGAAEPDAASAGQDATTIANQDGGVVGPDATSASDAASDVTTASGDGGALCGTTVPAGWSLAVFNSDAGTCPANFGSHIVEGPPTVATGACSCKCTVSQQGTCSHGTIAVSGAPGHGVDTCSSQLFTVAAGGSECVAQGSQTAFDSYAATVSGATSGTGGACTSESTANAGALTAPTQVYCDVPSTSADAICAGNAPAGFSACIVASGDVDCPASTPFLKKSPVQSLNGATFTCGACSACSVSTACGSPAVNIFTNGTCAGTPAAMLPANGSCIGAGEQAFASLQYNASPTSSCTAGTSAAAVQRAGQQTICCR